MRLTFCPRCGTLIDLTPPGACRQCGAEHWANPKPCAGGLVERDGTVLLLRRAHEPGAGLWDIPGGFCEEGEHPEATARREVREETGLEVQLGSYLGMWMDTFGDGDDDDPESLLNIYFRAVPGDPTHEPEPSAEALEHRWFRPTDLPTDLAFPHVRYALEAWRAAMRSSG